MLGKLLFIGAIVGAGYAFVGFRNNPSEISSPVYAEIRMRVKIPTRDITMVMYGKAVDREDCERRSEHFWAKVLPQCAECEVALSACRTDLEPRYKRLFDNEQIHATYIAYHRGSRFERDGRVVVWGLTPDEAQQACNISVSAAKGNYSGRVECILGVLP